MRARSGASSRAGLRPVRRATSLLALLVVSLWMHWLALAWIGGRLEVPSSPMVSTSVAVTLLAPPQPVTVPGVSRRAPRVAPVTQRSTIPEDSPVTVAPSAGPQAGDAAPAAPASSGPESPSRETPPTDDPPAIAQQETSAQSRPMPPVGRWRFLVFYGDYADARQLASVDYAITLDGPRYELRSEGRAEGLTALFYSGVLSQVSSGRVDSTGLVPERYTEQRGSRPERWARVDWSSGVANFSGGSTASAPAGVQDRLSVLVQLGLMARASPERFIPGAVLEIPELTLRDVERARYRVHGESVLQTSSGPIRALHLERIAPKRAEDPRIEAWLGYDRGLLPVRIRLTDVGGRVLDQLLLP